jgi:hypothetical protein
MLLEQRVAKRCAIPLLRYQTGDGGTLSREEFWHYVTTIRRPVWIRSSEGSDVVLTARPLEPQQVSPFLEDVRTHQMGLRDLAKQMGGEFDFAVEGTEARLEFAEFMSWMEQYDLGDLGAYSGNWRRPTTKDEKLTLVLEVSSDRWLSKVS